MKKTIYLLAFSLSLLLFYACQKDFLQVPDTTGNIDLTKVFSTRLNAEAALFNGYRRTLGYGSSDENKYATYNLVYGTLGVVSGERGKGRLWHPSSDIADGGVTANRSVLNYGSIFNNVRTLWTVYENIDKVPDMDADLKSRVKGECKGLIAYQYLYGLKGFGGIPIVEKTFDPSDDLTAPRASVDETVKFIVKLCDEALATLPSNWDPSQKGRLTKSAVLSIKAQTLMFAARPLFNSTSPYLSLGANNKLISYGSPSAQRWQDAITATQAALTEATSAGYAIINTGGTTGVPNTKAFDDYATATSVPGNNEVILASQIEETEAARYRNESGYWTNNPFNNFAHGLLGNFLPNYQKADGTEQNWPKVGDPTRPASDYFTRFAQMEPRFRADFAGPGVQALNNPNDAKWGPTSWGQNMGNYGTAAIAGITTNRPIYSYGYGCAVQTKFYYKAGNRIWLHLPLFRVPELYLNLAEAYNETDQPALALVNLNIVHNRAGLPSIIETDKIKLKALIQREWAVEFYDENKRYFDVRHWMLPNIGNGIVGGDISEFQFQTSLAGNKNLQGSLLNYYMAKVYTAFWNDRMRLEPFPQGEINKNAVIQNPGY
ncbi:hypothetical protein A5893_04945 [Pedobacter psychrophilus]|uniref:Carbohydrate-binding protein SusD n=1 Tax=Pedobacter psychrophilus TaxID=1826909 RepID=A0A179DIN6_9SPHI|nr:RagB/SusD family nutrient uptake outer membrane protein [Pedobacter psychrophilus]OAQ40303.1 hypothetical protein A5893_04945 [Pedobacter psychrophilus]